MERLRTEQPKGLTRAGIRKWGMMFLILGLFGNCVILNRYLGISGMTSDQLLQAMNSGSDVMTAVTVALVCKFIEACGVPIFCMLLAEGMTHTSNGAKYIIRILGVAVISEIPYNFAMTGNLLDTSSRNPVFGMLMAAVLLYLYNRFHQRTLLNLLYKTAFTIAAVFWSALLRIDSGIICVFITAVFWWFRNKPNIRNLMGGIAAMVCSLLSIFYMVAPMGMMVLHFYNGEKGEDNRVVAYLFYPAALILIGIVGVLAF